MKKINQTELNILIENHNIYLKTLTDIHKKGIKPDVEVKISDAQWKKAQKDEKADIQLKKAMELLKN